MKPKDYMGLSTKEILDDFNPFEIARKKRDGTFVEPSPKYHTYKKESPKCEAFDQRVEQAHKCEAEKKKRVVVPYNNTGRVVLEGATKPLDRIQCDICDNVYTRANGGSHRRSKRHKLYLEVQKKNWSIFKTTLS